ncbi:hypothetical protein [Methylopila sp. M107]|uniref:hypothetical protein n=1 Tax=Methylopila sp. M107 TaxID=1101190 RepID=UPI00037DC07E|nr:hypothetical protein [Methylopila sp. M107]
MFGRLLRSIANQYLRDRRAGTGSGPGRLPPTSVREAQHRVTGGIIRAIVSRLFRK